MKKSKNLFLILKDCCDEYQSFVSTKKGETTFVLYEHYSDEKIGFKIATFAEAQDAVKFALYEMKQGQK